MSAKAAHGRPFLFSASCRRVGQAVRLDMPGRRWRRVALEHPTLAGAGLVAAAAAAVHLHVGRSFGRRPAEPEARLPLRMFALWWVATGVNIMLGAGFIAAAAFGATDLWLQSTYAVLQRVLLAA